MKIAKMLERLIEMFPKQDYQSRLDRYIESRRPKSVAEVEHWQKHFDRSEFRKTVP